MLKEDDPLLALGWCRCGKHTKVHNSDYKCSFTNTIQAQASGLQLDDDKEDSVPKVRQQ